MFEMRFKEAFGILISYMTEHHWESQLLYNFSVINLDYL